MGAQCQGNGKHSVTIEIGFGAILNGINGKSLINGIGMNTKDADGQKGSGEHSIKGEELLPMQSLNWRRKGGNFNPTNMNSILQRLHVICWQKVHNVSNLILFFTG